MKSRLLKVLETKHLIPLILISILLLPFLAQAQISPFCIVSDTHVGAEDSVYGDFIKVVEEKNIKTIIHVGDAIHIPGSIKQWRKFLQITGSDKKLHLAPGNHDIKDKRSLEIFLRFFPDLYHSFSHEDTLFIILNTESPEEPGMIAGEQLQWLKNELERPFRYKFVFLHRPLFPIFSGRGLDRFKDARDELHRLFVKKGVSLVVSGHDHLYNRSLKDGIVYIIAAGGGGQSHFPAFNDA
ncbi:MAG TPA: metallophosphoesterase, partial [Syntrophorhabdaceae bacterium]|nr:metallophosphoesterase [Syntrophorhabdaceae bacterium]HRR72069.1 metallophosphoesterase [Syntrophorhabdaceae bacterium]HRV23033.1 metallophosphoesterase [Syntrophorhabdaceae bacterium]